MTLDMAAHPDDAQAAAPALPILHSGATTRLRAILAFHDSVRLAPFSHTIMFVHPAARLLVETSRQHLTPLKEWSVMTAQALSTRAQACVTSLKEVGTRDVYRHIYGDMRNEAHLVARLRAMRWWLVRAPVFDLSLRSLNPLLSARLGEFLTSLCAPEEPEHEQRESEKRRPRLRRLTVEMHEEIPSDALLTFLTPFRTQLNVLHLSDADLSAFQSPAPTFPALETLNLTDCTLPRFHRFIALFTGLDSLVLETCRGVEPPHPIVNDDDDDDDNHDANGVKTLSSYDDEEEEDVNEDGAATPLWLATLAKSLTWLTLNSMSNGYFPDLSWVSHLPLLDHLEVSFHRQPMDIMDMSKVVCRIQSSPSVSLARLRTLNLRHSAVVDLTALQYVPSLEVLDLSSCGGVTTLSVFQAHRCGNRLRELHLSNTSIDSVEPLSSRFCPSLALLDLDQCENVTDFEPLGEAHQLQDLTLSRTCVADLSWIAHCTQLKSLKLVSCAQLASMTLRDESGNVAPGPFLPLLRVLDSSSSHLTSLAGWARCAALEEVNLSDCGLVLHLDGLAGAQNLRKINLRSCTGLSRLDGLNQCPKLESVTADHCVNLLSVDGLDGSASLRVLSVSGSDIARLPQNCPRLVTVQACNCANLTDVSGLAVAAATLATVQLAGSPVQDVSALAACTGLFCVQLEDCSLSAACAADLSFLRGSCTRLSEVSLSGNDAIQSLEGLRGATSLVSLWIDRCGGVSDLAPLGTCGALAHLSLDSTHVRSLAPLATCRALRGLSVCACTGVTSLTGLCALPALMTLRATGAPLASLDEVSAMVALRELIVDESDAIRPETVKAMLAARSATSTPLRVHLRDAEGRGTLIVTGST